ncbi:autoinducer binding domain-containing protein [Paraburkholderia phenazinium]|jgi:LuxR family quorum-sensing system transcriptional regulator SolR|uniref:LuxR family transcriptional regulator n=1 Tax=Paraburkholderia phenazinium TaxID=60549 RepID=A0A1G7YYC7_9BURK|nr:autoinducer binding domain-containing protein [Paraburkholderia phenazinium]SDH01417.1 LuxR family transcriptional regulator [Paraburkholderia phenazinium]
MDNWRENVMGRIEQARDSAEVFSVVARSALSLGFEYCAFGMRMPIPLSRLPIYLRNNYPLRWQQIYRESGYLRADPTVSRGLGSTLPFLWPAPTTNGSEFWQAAWSHGLAHGWAQSARDPSGAIGMFTFARSHTPIERAELDANESHLEWLAHFGHTAMARALLPSTLPEVSNGLSEREREVLLWSAEGKTAAEIGSILGVAESTINYHVTNAVKKLRASNKIHAVAKAALLGLLFTGFVGTDASIGASMPGEPMRPVTARRPNEVARAASETCTPD